jgi:hypothetical protein
MAIASIDNVLDTLVDVGTVCPDTGGCWDLCWVLGRMLLAAWYVLRGARPAAGSE